MIAKLIQKLRKNKGLSQEFIAVKLGISRPTFMKIEKGELGLSLEQAERLAAILGISLDELRSGKDRSPIVSFEKEENKSSGRQEIRISVPQKNLKKFREVFLYILSKVGGKSNVGESVLNKLLYFIDFDYYEKYEEQLIGATYIKNHFGPTPCELKKIVDDMKSKKEIEEVKSKYFKYDQKKYLSLREPDLSVLTAQELEHIDGVLGRLSDKSAKEISDYSHADIPWVVHKEGEPISYESVFYRDDKHSVRNYEDEL